MSSSFPATPENVYLACNASALAINELSRSLPNDSVDIREYDERMGDTHISDPLNTSHRLLGMYLIGAGDFLYSIGKLVGLENPMVMSPGALARSVMEYSSRAWWIATAPDPDLRALRGHTLIRSGYSDAKKTGIEDIPGSKRIDHTLNSWRAKRPNLPKVSTPKIANLVEAMLGDQGKRSYNSLSEVAHGNALTLIVSAVGSAAKDPTSLESVLIQAIHANMVALIAAERTTELWNVRPDDLDHCVQLCRHLMVEDDQDPSQDG
ncbi:hypothetical protein HF877_06235 [Rhodococcus sp. BL-253-APC-6A1W]|uniref:hypothetical protein n=1 Tax=Rhodococcus sp. BL-253-APC-6A1W TaxID=2725307 RepID=UPI00146BD68B|nr:hypothetical protein [Rhodococcus sp. BL-253-APC-6A1W]NMD95001.1 hypothetical protein [Rhodococcus sp. BL-253-APC-6A1W]